MRIKSKNNKIIKLRLKIKDLQFYFISFRLYPLITSIDLVNWLIKV